MNGISQNAETSWDQNDPQPCPQGDLNPDQCILKKKVMEKIKFRLVLYQLSYAAKLQKSAIFHYSYQCELQTKYTKGNRYIIHIEIMKYAIYAKSAQLNSVFCLDFEFFHHFPPSRVVQRPPAFIWYYGCIWPVWFLVKKFAKPFVLSFPF
jgi:hypothetical protein